MSNASSNTSKQEITGMEGVRAQFLVFGYLKNKQLIDIGLHSFSRTKRDPTRKF